MRDCIPYDRAFKFPNHLNIQWKGADVSLGFTCQCGKQHAYTGLFCTFIKCPDCDSIYWLNNSIEVVELNDLEKRLLQRHRAKVWVGDKVETLHWQGGPIEGEDRMTKVWPLARANPQPGSAYLHYAGTDACVDVYCPCEDEDSSHYCRFGASYFKHPCGRIYWVSPHVQAIKLNERELAAFVELGWRFRLPVSHETLFEG